MDFAFRPERIICLYFLENTSVPEVPCFLPVEFIGVFFVDVIAEIANEIEYVLEYSLKFYNLRFNYKAKYL